MGTGGAAMTPQRVGPMIEDMISSKGSLVAQTQLKTKGLQVRAVFEANKPASKEWMKSEHVGSHSESRFGAGCDPYGMNELAATPLRQGFVRSNIDVPVRFETAPQQLELPETRSGFQRPHRS
eukprot:5374934-Pyramimonas_sp.AAC.1